jgi:catechol 2,3-dioxygenase-like lactoylglutathione lyase family enzyme
MQAIQAFKSVVLTSPSHDVTARFYRDALLLPLEAERHRGTELHWACRLGEMHFAIHPSAGFWLPTSGDSDSSATFVTFTVEDIEASGSHLASRGVEIVARNKIGPMSFIAVRDPDGRLVCLGTPWPTGGGLQARSR